ncbi:MAG: hypothetical protein IIZ92_03350 [Aquincola sp.]|nr:hypothetical protein [Aquincola sp.]
MSATELATAEYVQQLERFCELLVNPTQEMLDEFQRAFLRQLKLRKHFKPGWEDSAEVAGAKAMIKMAAAALPNACAFRSTGGAA